MPSSKRVTINGVECVVVPALDAIKFNQDMGRDASRCASCPVYTVSVYTGCRDCSTCSSLHGYIPVKYEPLLRMRGLILEESDDADQRG